MPGKNPTFEEVDKHIQKAKISAVPKSAKGATAEAIPNVCGAYKTVKPILQLLLNTPFLPKKWKDAIKAFMSVLDTICP
jgi:hypothetical protein